MEKELAGLVAEIEEMDEKIEEGLERWQALLDKRMEINEYFADVKYKLGQSKSSPHNHITKPSSSDKAAMEKYEDDVELLEGYIEEIKELVSQIDESNKETLAEYVVHRRRVLELLDATRRFSGDGSRSPEDTIHDLIFKRFSDSTDINYFEHNLWVIDDTLAFVPRNGTLQ